MEDEKKNLKVNIFGSEYTLKAGAIDNGKIYKIAEYVDSKMREVQNVKPNRPLHQIAILAALNIAEELFEIREGEDDLLAYKLKIKEITQKLELGIKTISEANERVRK